MIIIKKLHLENFMIVEEADFEFDDNQITAIIGDNGNGKSTIFYAIAYCLTGYRKGETLRDYIKVGSNSTNIVLEAIYKGKDIKYDVSITKQNTSGQTVKKVVTYDGVTYINSEYNAFMKAENLEELETVTFMFQGNSALMDARPSERANLLKRIFKSEFPEQVLSCKESLDKTKINIAELNAIVDELKTHTFNPVDIFREASDDFISDCKTRLEENIKKIDKIGNIDASALSECESKLTSCQRQISDTENKIRTDEESLSVCKDRIAEYRKELAKVNIDELKKSSLKLDNDIQSHEISYEKTKKRNEELESKFNILSYKHRELNDQYKISKTGVCHACGQPIEESHVKKLAEQIEASQKDMDEVSSAITELNFDKSDAEGKRLKREQEYINQQIAKYDQQTKYLQTLEEKESDLTTNLSDRKDYLNVLNTQKEQLIKSKKELSSLVPLIEEKENLLKEKESLERTLEIDKETRIKNIERRATNKKLEEDKRACEERITELSDKINTLTVENTQRKVLLDIFETQLPNYLVVKMCDKLSDFINITIQKVFPYCKVKLLPSKSGVGFFYTTESSDDEYIPISMASGAQEKVLNLAYFIALSKLSGVSCVFLDEIDASCSADNAKEIYDFIASLDCFNQIFFISHRAEAVEAVKAKNEKLVTYSVANGNYTRI